MYMYVYIQWSASSAATIGTIATLSHLSRESQWGLGSVLASQSADCGVESRRCLNPTGRSLSVSITELSKAMVGGALYMGHFT